MYQTSSSLPKNKKFGMFFIMMLSLGSVLSVRTVSFLAGQGLAAIFYYGIAVSCFMIPYALIAAHLGSLYPGGVFVWAKEAFGPRWGFVAVWFQWFHNIAWYPAVLSFFALSLGRWLSPAITENNYFVPIVILVVFWGLTFLNFLKMSFSSYLSTICLIIGTIIPGLILIGMAIFWLSTDQPSLLSLSLKTILPQSNGLMSSIAMTAGVLLTLTGLETNANLVSDMKNPRKNYPIALLLASGLLLFFLVGGTLSVAVVIPKQEIHLINTLIDALTVFLSYTGLKWPIKVISGAILFGILGQMNIWMIAPTKGLWNSANNGCLPAVFIKSNKNKSPVFILLFQATLVSLSAISFFFISNFNLAYWIFNLFCTQVCLTMYMIMLLSALVLHYKDFKSKKNHGLLKSSFSITSLAIMGIISIITTLGISFIPPGNLIDKSQYFTYEIIIVIGFVFCLLLPHLMYRNKKKKSK